MTLIFLFAPHSPFAKEEFTDRCLKAEAVSYDIVVDKEVVFYEMNIKTVDPDDFRVRQNKSKLHSYSNL